MRILHLITGIVGFYLVYLTYVMKESTEGIWINRIEELWIRVDDRHKSVGETTKALFSSVADKVSRGFNRIFGVKLISLRAIGTSGSLSFASFLITFGVGILFLYYLVTKHSLVIDPQLLKQEPLLIFGGIFGIGLGLFCLILAFLPMVVKSPFWVWLSCLPTGFWLYLTFRLIRRHLLYGGQLGLSAALATSFASDVLLIMLIRQSLRWIMVHTSMRRIFAALLLQAAALYLIFVIPYRLPTLWRPELAKQGLGVGLFALAIFNIPTVLASIAFVLSLFVVILHRIVWPLLSQLTYVLTRNEVLDKRKTVRTLGFVCIAYAFSGHFWQQIVQRVLK